MAGDKDRPLREDIRLLGDILGHTLQAQCGDNLFALEEQVRLACKRLRHRFDPMVEKGLLRTLDSLDLGSTVHLVRAFSTYLKLANNAAEYHGTRRRRKWKRVRPSGPQPGAIVETLARLRATAVPATAIRALLPQLSIDLVFTAHPTEVARGSVLLKHREIAGLLEERYDPRLGAQRRREIEEELAEIIERVWQTDEIRAARGCATQFF